MLYAEVADQIAGMITAGTLRAGDRVPSVRTFSEQRKVSISTVVQAYALLENRGVIESRPRSGYYVKPRVAPMPSEPKPQVRQRAPVRVQTAATILDIFSHEMEGSLAHLASALPSPDLFPTQGWVRALTRVSRSLGTNIHRYEHAPGHLPLRRALARRSLELGTALSAEEIIITVGALEALNLCLRAVARPGDVIAIESPTYFGILQVMESLGLRAISVPTHSVDGMDVEALRGMLAVHPIKAVVAMPNFNNPLGSRMPDERKQALVELLEQHQIPLIEDDVYGDLPALGARPRAAKSYDRTGNVLLISGLSKSLSPGARVGWVAPGRYFEEIRTLKFLNTIATPTVLQAAAADFLHSGSYDRHLRRMQAAFAEQVAKTSDAVIRHFPEGTRLSRPQGGYVLWVELPLGIDCVALNQQAAAKKVRFAPGPLFSAEGAFRNCLRLNCGYPFTAQTEEAIRIVGRLAGQRGKIGSEGAPGLLG